MAHRGLAWLLGSQQGDKIQGPPGMRLKSLVRCGYHQIRSGRAVGTIGASVPVPGAPGISSIASREASEWPMPQFINIFLLEFPIRPLKGQQLLKILGLVAKVSFGTILKVLDCGQKSVFAVKVVPKVMILQRDTLRQCKEEVSIQRQINHPFLHCLGDSWQEKQTSSLRERICRFHQFGQEAYKCLEPRHRSLQTLPRLLVLSIVQLLQHRSVLPLVHCWLLWLSA